MKKKLLSFFFAAIFTSTYNAQCVYTCSNYAVSAITYTTFPSGSTNLTPTFTNTFLGVWPDDGSIGPIPIGFSFDYYCNTYTSVHICSNGFIMLDYAPFPWPSQYVHPPQSFPDPFNLPDGIIAYNMTDLDPGQGGTVTYTTVGVSPNRMFIVTYSNVPCFTTPSNVNTGQIVLFETTNMIEIHTGSAFPDVNQASLGSTQGIENTTGSSGITPPGRNANNSWGGSSAANTAYLFSPFTPAPPTSVTGNTTLCEGEGAYYQATYMNGSSAYGWSFPIGWNGTSTISSITASAGVSGNLSVTATYTCGTSAPTTLAINVNPAPIVSIVSASPSILCSGSTVTFNTSGALTYTLSPGGINGTPTFTDIASVSTTYTLTGTNANGCVSVNNPTTFISVKETPIVSVNSGAMCSGETFTMTPSGANSYVYSSLFSSVSPTTGIYSYSVTGTGTNGCVSVPAISNLTVYALPTVTTAASRSVMCVKEKVTLSVGGANSYTWSTGATTSTLLVGPTTNTSYFVLGINNNGCANTSTVTVTVMQCIGIENQSFDNSTVSIFPNPSHGIFLLQVNDLALGSHIEIYNSLGELIINEILTDEKTELNLTNYSNGFYFVKVKDPLKEQTLKIIKQ